jgi:hypothetical protein
MAAELTHEYLLQILNYDPETGEFTNRVSRGQRAISGDRAGTEKLNGFLYMLGEWPKFQVDHINGNRDDNRWSNLREATCAQNVANTGIRKSNTSKMKGVYWDKENKRWRAQIQHHGKKLNLGRFDTKEEASDTYNAAAINLRGEFHRETRPIKPAAPMRKPEQLTLFADA